MLWCIKWGWFIMQANNMCAHFPQFQVPIQWNCSTTWYNHSPDNPLLPESTVNNATIRDLLASSFSIGWFSANRKCTVLWPFCVECILTFKKACNSAQPSMCHVHVNLPYTWTALHSDWWKILNWCQLSELGKSITHPMANMNCTHLIFILWSKYLVKHSN